MTIKAKIRKKSCEVVAIDREKTTAKSRKKFEIMTTDVRAVPAFTFVIEPDIRRRHLALYIDLKMKISNLHQQYLIFIFMHALIAKL